MDNQSSISTEIIQRAFKETEAQRRIGNTRVGCVLVMLLMPAGIPMDFFVYPDHFRLFFQLRLWSAIVAMAIWGIMHTAWGQRWSTLFGWIIPLVPVFFITWMIAASEGFQSSYYAGLNLVLLAVGAVLNWTFLESIFFVTIVLFTYITTGIMYGVLNHVPARSELLANNFFFIGCMDIIVVVGTFFAYRQREREFSLRYQLDEEKKKTEQRNQELADAYQKLTEQESQLVQSQKMASIGQMSAGIIHEINNPLNFATTGLFTLKKKGKHLPAEQRAEYDDIVKDIEDGITRVKNIVSDLRTFTHPNTDILDQVVVSDVVTSALRFLSNEVKEKVIIEQKLPAGQTVRANKNKLIHLFVNLIQNSLDALRTKPFPNGEQPTIWIEGRVENGSNYLIVRDNGPGIPSDQVDKIYDPFFTTKAVGEGMGLGLSMCSRIMKDSQGKISVRTEKDKFCEFTLEFPDKT